MFEVGIKFIDPAVQHSNCVFDHVAPKKGSGYKGVAKVLWNLMKRYPEHNLWVYTNAYVKKDGHETLFMEFGDILYHQAGYDGRKMLSTRKGVQKYLRHIRGCVRYILEREVPERLKTSEPFNVTYLD